MKNILQLLNSQETVSIINSKSDEEIITYFKKKGIYLKIEKVKLLKTIYSIKSKKMNELFSNQLSFMKTICYIHEHSLNEIVKYFNNEINLQQANCLKKVFSFVKIPKKGVIDDNQLDEIVGGEYIADYIKFFFTLQAPNSSMRLIEGVYKLGFSPVVILTLPVVAPVLGIADLFSFLIKGIKKLKN